MNRRHDPTFVTGQIDAWTDVGGEWVDPDGGLGDDDCDGARRCLNSQRLS